ncbi:hypothetical protein GIB67_018330, partial [Kingdonia uniflora]
VSQSYCGLTFRLFLQGHAEQGRICAREQAEEVQRNLDPKHPSFVKSLVRSNVGSSFILSLPAEFCNLHLPKQNITVTLIDEDKETCTSNFIYKRKGLSAGWGGFSTSHNLAEGDVLVFQLVKPDEFQVYIRRAYGSSRVDRGLSLQNFDGPAKKSNPGKRIKPNEKIKGVGQRTQRRGHKTLRLADLQPKVTDRGHEFEKTAGEIGSKVSCDVMFCENLERKDFDTAIDGLKKNSDLNEYTWTKYYELCQSQKMFLHKDLLDCCYNLIGGIIYEIVKIADDIKASNLSTSRDEYSTWDKKLKAFELLGMNVGFLHDKLQKLLSFYLDGERVALEIVKRSKS